MAVDDIRYYLNGIYVEKAERGGVYVVACDGHMLAVSYEPSGVLEGAENCIFKASEQFYDAVKSASKAAAKDCLGYSVFIKRERVMIGLPGEGKDFELYTQAAPCFIEGKFPDWKAILPKDFTKLRPGIRSTAMNARLLAAAAKRSAKCHGTLMLWQEAIETCVVGQYTDEPNLLMILMPIRDEPRVCGFEQFTFAQPGSAPLPGKQPSDTGPVSV
jgi:hypothetical protein